MSDSCECSKNNCLYENELGTGIYCPLVLVSFKILFGDKLTETFITLSSSATYKFYNTYLKINKLYNCDKDYIVWRPITDYFYLQETFGTTESSIFPWKFLQIAETLFLFWEETMLIWSNTMLKQSMQSKSIAISPAQVPLNPRYVTSFTCRAEFY